MRSITRLVFHRDVKPENILITESFDPILIDFGGASSNEAQESLTVLESAGYTPFEQLNRKGHIGAWTDLYALGATFSFAILSEKLPNSVDRFRNDTWVPLAGRAHLRYRYSNWLLRSIDKAFEVNELARFQSAVEWLDLIKNEQDQQSEKLKSSQDFVPERDEFGLGDVTERHEYNPQDGISEYQASIHESELDVNGETDSSGRYSSACKPKPASPSLWKEILYWVFLIPGVFVGSSVVHFIAKLLAFLFSSSVMLRNNHGKSGEFDFPLISG